MRKIISCCGVVCSECGYFASECDGCPAVKGKVFWLEYTGEEVCDIYDCCMKVKGLVHCGQCPQLPCERYEREDPTKTAEENSEDFRKQLEQLRGMDDEWRNGNLTGCDLRMEE